MKVAGIIQHQQGLPVLGAGLDTFGIFRLGQLFRFSHRHQLIREHHKLGSFLGGFIRFILVHDILEPFAYTAGISASECGSQFVQCVLTAICIVPILIRVIIESELVDVCCQLLDRVLWFVAAVRSMPRSLQISL